MIPVPLYDHQSELNESCRQSMIAGNKHVLIQSPTGSGKSQCAASQIQQALAKNKRSIFNVPRRELVYQMSEKFSSYGIPHSFIVDKYEHNPHALVHISTTGTLANRVVNFKPAVVFYDEVHIGGSTLDAIIKYYQSIGSYSVGLSATPWRLDGRGLGCWFQDMVSGKSVDWLIQNKYLSQYRLFQCSNPNLTGIKTIGGDYAKGQLAELMEEDKVLIGRAVDHYRQHAIGRINITFCVSRKHAEITNQNFKDQGIASAYVDGETPDHERKQIFRALARREILNVTSVDLINTGFDLSMAAGMDVCVESISDLRPTKSLALQMQKWGRALRKKDYPALIFDHAGNSLFLDGTPNHGLPDTEREWSLESREKSSKAMGEKTFAVKSCGQCFFVHRPAPQCPQCGHIYPVQSREIEEIEGTLIELTAEELKSEQANKKRAEKAGMKKRRAAAKTLDDLIKFAEEEGYVDPEAWAAKWDSMRSAYKKGRR